MEVFYLRVDRHRHYARVMKTRTRAQHQPKRLSLSLSNSPRDARFPAFRSLRTAERSSCVVEAVRDDDDLVLSPVAGTTPCLWILYTCFMSIRSQSAFVTLFTLNRVVSRFDRRVLTQILSYSCLDSAFIVFSSHF